ncbi:MAG: hypothetical protein KC492_20255 [Myxococcales bacterium]|nr:hypothetical protein [Myxococcales bacterium]
MAPPNLPQRAAPNLPQRAAPNLPQRAAPNLAPFTQAAPAPVAASRERPPGFQVLASFPDQVQLIPTSTKGIIFAPRGVIYEIDPAGNISRDDRANVHLGEMTVLTAVFADPDGTYLDAWNREHHIGGSEAYRWTASGWQKVRESGPDRRFKYPHGFSPRGAVVFSEPSVPSDDRDRGSFQVLGRRPQPKYALDRDQPGPYSPCYAEMWMAGFVETEHSMVAWGDQCGAERTRIEWWNKQGHFSHTLDPKLTEPPSVAEAAGTTYVAAAGQLYVLKRTFEAVPLPIRPEVLTTNADGDLLLADDSGVWQWKQGELTEVVRFPVNSQVTGIYAPRGALFVSLGQRVLGTVGPQVGLLDLFTGQQPKRISEGKLANSDCEVPFVWLASEQASVDPVPTRKRLQKVIFAYTEELEGTLMEEVDGASRYFGFSEENFERARRLQAFVRAKGLTSARVLCAVPRELLPR